MSVSIQQSSEHHAPNVVPPLRSTGITILPAFLITACFAMLLLSCSNVPSKEAPEAHKGRLDLSTWNFEKDGVVRLDGEWEFYWKQLLKPEDFARRDPLLIPDYIRPPDTWDEHVAGGTTLGNTGFATYRRSEEGTPDGKSAIRNPQSEVDLELLEKALSLYKGPFLPSDSAHPWVLSYRERLRSKFLRAVIKLGTHWEQAAHWKRAAEVFRKGLEVDGHTEEYYQHLMICHQQLGQQAEAVRVYDRCRLFLTSTLGIAPSPRTEELYLAIKNGR